MRKFQQSLKHEKKRNEAVNLIIIIIKEDKQYYITKHNCNYEQQKWQNASNCKLSDDSFYFTTQ